ncbi:hypothetical protein HOU71_gp45 [Pectobacterium phage Clickz]|uniref:Uncharacterized protein n=8 Tax=Phimunavirus TaxID=2560202 RepID=A0A3G8FH11_9CAUD|nr:hypothetical protein HOU71_gp45 [Pectobacterium phage Clickz]YP_009817251.1 hypothetical protein HOU73_gp39 [Pectobacterium phage Koot]AXY81887.1 hypothetical protein [Pectobacterium phage Momine]AZF94202.1 hypothetical protein [Pectobacterium phage Clickz_B3]AZF94290.1 hypothetical protein [Pectobacterium phage Clickz_B5]AZF94385.1 hypothetical protein [Pectobacterium phage Clickz_B7]AZF94498.1 hypothetical protein [Pectobacterium phage Ekidair]AZF94677.1 hypothetical protein [Pectobacte
MRVPKRNIREAQQNASLNMRDGFSASECWRSAMVSLKWQYHKAHKQAVDYGFIKT